MEFCGPALQTGDQLLAVLDGSGWKVVEAERSVWPALELRDAGEGDFESTSAAAHATLSSLPAGLPGTSPAGAPGGHSPGETHTEGGSMRIDFEMTYPAYVPLGSDDIPWTIGHGDGRALAVHTDADLLDRFLLLNAPRTRRSWSMLSSAARLASYLQSVAGQSWPTLTHVLIDPTDLRRAARVYALPEFVDFLLSTVPEQNSKHNNPGQPS